MRQLLFFFLLMLATACSNEDESKSPPPPPAPARVEVETITATTLIEERAFLGEVRNASSTVLAAGGSGAVTRVDVREGDAVTKGQTLVQLDDGILRARLDEVRAELSRTEVQLAQSRRDVERFTALSEKGHFPGAEAEQVASRTAALEAAVAGQQAAVQRLREEIAQMRIAAPTDGVVARRFVSKGQWLQVGQPAVEVTSRGALEVHVRVASRVLDLLGTDATVRIEGEGGEVAGTVAGVVGALDPRTRTALLRVLPAAPKPWLREGDAVNVSVDLPRQVEGVVVSTDALVYGVAGTRVFRVKDGKAEPHAVTVVSQDGAKALVAAKELAVGDTIVARGNERLRPGQDVQVAK